MRSLWSRCCGSLLAFLTLGAPLVHAGAHSSMFGPREAQPPETVLLVHARYLLAQPGEAPLENHTLVIRRDRIADIRPGFVSAADYAAESAEDINLPVTVIDQSNGFVMPGLLDAHVHLARATGSYQGGFAAANSVPPVAEATVNAMTNARLSLAAGFTAVRDLGSDPHSVFAVRDAISAGDFAGPTIIASGPSISVTAGHGDDAASANPDERARAGVCDGPDECRTLTRHLEKSGADLIKIKITGGFSSNTGLRQHMSAAEMRAVVEAAHMRGLKVTAHAYEPGAIAQAVEVGVDSIEHGYLLNSKTLKAMRRSNVYLVPTLIVAEPPAMVKRFLRGREPISVQLRNSNQAFEQAYQLGLNIGFGTDCGIYPHGRNADEMLEMVRLGMSPADVLRAATVTNAALFGIDGVTGTLEADSLADVIAVSGNPLDDIAAMQEVGMVIKSGRIVKQDGRMRLPLDYSRGQKY